MSWWARQSWKIQRALVGTADIHVVNDLGSHDFRSSDSYFDEEVTKPRREGSSGKWTVHTRLPLEAQFNTVTQREAHGAFI